jgi:DNA-binding transcriptional LysR family regulator
MNHTTVARRVHALEAAMGGRLLVESPGGWELSPLGQSACEAARSIETALTSLGQEPRTATQRLQGLVRITAPEIFTIEIVAPAVAAVSHAHPGIRFELISVTRPTPYHGPSADLDIAPTRTASRRLATRRLADYQLGLFAARSYLADRGPIHSRADLRDHIPIYYVESMLQVADLDLIDQFFPHRSDFLGATSVETQARLVAAGTGVGLLPVYYANRHSELERVLAAEAVATLTYWMMSRPANLRRAEVAEVANAIADHATAVLSDH